MKDLPKLAYHHPPKTDTLVLILKVLERQVVDIFVHKVSFQTKTLLRKIFLPCLRLTSNL